MKKFRGTYTVLITPFTADGKKVDETALKRLVDFQIDEGLHGLIPLGSTGEFLSVTPAVARAGLTLTSAPARQGPTRWCGPVGRPSRWAPTGS